MVLIGELNAKSLEENLKEAEKSIKEAENFSGTLDTGKTIYKGVEALYYQNQVIIEQNNEILKYLKELKK